jgi:hypothetical protein
MNTEIDSKIEALKDMENDLLVRIYGALPDLSIIGGEEKSVYRTDATARRREKS